MRPLALVLILSACVGTAARENVLLPALSVTWSVIVAPAITDGLAASDLPAEAVELRLAAVERVQLLLDSGDAAKALTIVGIWPVLEPLALAGIEARLADGDIGPGVAASLRETVRLFGVRLAQLVAS